MLTKLRQQAQASMAYGARVAHKAGITPNVASSLGILAAVAAALLYSNRQFHPLHLIAASTLLLVSGFFDAIDGVIARLFGQTTVFGGFLDSMLDRYADALTLAAIILAGYADFFWGIFALIGSLLVSYSRARAEAAGVKMETVGVAERAERIIIVVTASILTIVWPFSLWWAIVFLAFLTNLTVLQRAVYFRGALKIKKSATPVV